MIHYSWRVAKKFTLSSHQEETDGSVCFVYRYTVLSPPKFEFSCSGLKVVKCQQTSVSLEKLCKISNVNLQALLLSSLFDLICFPFQWKLAFVLKSDTVIDCCKGGQNNRHMGEGFGVVYMHEYVFIYF